MLVTVEPMGVRKGSNLITLCLHPNGLTILRHAKVDLLAYDGEADGGPRDGARRFAWRLWLAWGEL